ncbi:MAG: hypothetical protein QOJ79_2190 [Actinomycetota bacterium]|jgi:hypothetical protein|nr:hypothetical protein [Actinomycetota bacterium]
MNKRIWAVASATVVALGILPVAHAVAGGTTPTETGCYDITPASQGAFNDVLKSASQTGSGTLVDPYGPVKPTYFANAASLDSTLVLGAASCPTATYSVLVFPRGSDPSKVRPLRTITQPGDGTTGTSRDNPLEILGLFDHQSEVCVDALVQVLDGRTVIDTAPDTGTKTICKDGTGAQGFGG